MEKDVPLDKEKILVDIFFHGTLNPGVSFSSGLKERDQPAKK